jgi:hypothetical protein
METDHKHEILRRVPRYLLEDLADKNEVSKVLEFAQKFLPDIQ